MRHDQTTPREPDGMNPGPEGIRRDYTPQDVERLAGSFRIRHTLAERGAARLRSLLMTEPFVPTLGALTGNQALQPNTRTTTLQLHYLYLHAPNLMAMACRRSLQ